MRGTWVIWGHKLIICGTTDLLSAVQCRQRTRCLEKDEIHMFSQFTNFARTRFFLGTFNSGTQLHEDSFLPLLCSPAIKFRCQLQLPHLLSNELLECAQYHKLMITVYAYLRVDIFFKLLASCRLVIASLCRCWPMSSQHLKPSCRCYTSAAGCCFV